MCTQDCGRLQPPDEAELVDAFEIALGDAFAFLGPEYQLEAAPLTLFSLATDEPVRTERSAVEYPFLVVQEFTGNNPPVRITYGDKAYRLGLEIGANGSGFHSLETWLHALEIPREDRDDTGVATPTALGRHARHLAHTLRTHFDTIRDAGPDAMVGLPTNGSLPESREQANAAFADGDYAGYVRLLGPFSDSLTVTELRKLSFAKERIA